MGDTEPVATVENQKKIYPNFLQSSEIRTNVFSWSYEKSGDEQQRNWNRLGNLLEKIKAEPELLASMPPLPLDPSNAPAGEVRLRHIAESLGVSFDSSPEVQSQWMENASVDQELLDFTFDIRSKFSSMVTREVFGIKSLITKHIGYYKEDTGDNVMSVRKLLETLRPLVVGQEYVDHHSQVALEEIKKANPEYLPQSPIEFVYVPDLEGKGAYLGRLNGVHYVASNPRFDLNPYLSPAVNPHQYPDQHDISSEIHEVLHAKTAEEVGMENFFLLKAPFESFIPSVPANSPHEALMALFKTINDPESNVAQDPTMGLNLLEGLAYLGQIGILNHQIENCTDSQKQPVLVKLREVLWNKLRYIDEDGQPYSSDYVYMLRRYRDGVAHINQIRHVLGDQNAVDTILNIDFKVLSQFPSTSPEAKVIKSDPTKLPQRPHSTSS